MAAERSGNFLRTLRSSSHGSGGHGDHHADAHGEVHSAQQEEQSTDWRFRRSAFINEVTFGREVNSRGEIEEKPTNVDLSPELIKEYGTFLGTYIDRLGTIKQTNQTLWESDLMRENRMIFDKISHGGSPDTGYEATIQEYLKTSEGILRTTSLMTKFAELSYNAIGQRADYIPGRGHDVTLREGELRLNIGRGALRRLGDWVRRSDDPMRESFLRKLIRPGERIRVDTNDTVGLARIQSSPQMREYVQAMIGVNVDRFTVDPATGRVVRPQSEGDRVKIKEVQKQAESHLRFAAAFNRQLGVDASTGRQFVFRERFSSETLGTQNRFAEETQRRFKELLRTLPDQWGQNADNPWYLRGNGAGAPLPVNPPPRDEENYFDRANAAGVQGRQTDMLNLYDQAELEAASDVTARSIRARQVQEEKESLTSAKVYVDTKKINLPNQQIEYQERQREITEVLGELEKDEAVYTTQREAARGLSEARDAFYTEFTYPDIPTAEADLVRLLDTDTPGSINRRKADLETTIQAEFDRLIAGRFGTPPNYAGTSQKELERIQNSFTDIARGGVRNAVKEAIANDERTLTDQRIRLREIQRTINQRERELLQGDALRAVNQLQQSLASDMGQIVGWSITEAQLATESYDTLIGRINQAHAVNNTHGWAEALNTDAANRQRLLRAMVEARGLAAERNRYDPAGTEYSLPNAQERADYSFLVGSGISDTQMRTLSQTELEGILVRRRGAPLPAGFGDRIRRARTYADRKVTIRREATERLRGEFVRQQNTEKVLESAAGVNRTEIENRLTEISKIIGRATADESVFGRTGEIVRDITDYTNDHAVPAAGTARTHEFTNAERTFGAPEGYYRWLQLLTNYQEDESNPVREAAFLQASSVITPAFLSEVIHDSLALNMPRAQRNNMTRVLRRVHARGVLPEDQVYTVIRNVMRRLAQEGRTAA